MSSYAKEKEEEKKKKFQIGLHSIKYYLMIVSGFSNVHCFSLR